MTIFLISDCICELCFEKMTTSSQKYEYSLAKALTSFATVKILSSKLTINNDSVDGNLSLIGIKNKKSLYSGVADEIKKVRGEKVVIFWGYDLKKVVSIHSVSAKCRDTLFLPFIYDSHKTATSVFVGIKKILANIYFELGAFLLRFFDGFILFQQNAVQRLYIGKKPHLVIKPGVYRREMLPKTQNAKTFLVSYCGTFSNLNGIDELLKVFEKFKNTNVRFMLCGTGPLLDQVLAAEKKYHFVKYGGLINDEELKKLYSESNLLLNLRRLEDEAMDYAFPSKAFECINTGLPVLTTKILEDEFFVQNSYIVENVCEKDITDMILKVMHDEQTAHHKASLLKEYIENHYSFEKSAKEIVAFIDRIG